MPAVLSDLELPFHPGNCQEGPIPDAPIAMAEGEGEGWQDGRAGLREYLD